MPNQVLGARKLWFNGQDQIARSGNYYCSSIRVASIDESKNKAIEIFLWLTLKPLVQTASLFAGVKRGESCWVWSPDPTVRKISYRAQTKTKNSKMQTYFCGLHHMGKQRQDDQQEPIYNDSEPIQDVALKTYRKRRTIETVSERWSGRSGLMMI